MLIILGDGDMPDGIWKPPEELAELIEDHIFKQVKSTSSKYKNQVRSRVFNLKDKKNPALRENVLCGVISVEKIATMSSEEMASDEVNLHSQILFLLNHHCNFHKFLFIFSLIIG